MHRPYIANEPVYSCYYGMPTMHDVVYHQSPRNARPETPSEGHNEERPRAVWGHSSYCNICGCINESFDSVVRGVDSQDLRLQVAGSTSGRDAVDETFWGSAGKALFRSCRTTCVELTSQAQKRLSVPMTNMNDLVSVSRLSQANIDPALRS